MGYAVIPNIDPFHCKISPLILEEMSFIFVNQSRSEWLKQVIQISIFLTFSLETNISRFPLSDMRRLFFKRCLPNT